MGDRLEFVDVCAGAGGLASGLESAGFSPVLLLDNKRQACETLLANRPHWNVVCEDLVDFLPDEHPQTLDVDLLSAGLPRVKASAAAARTDSDQELRLLTATIYLVHSIQPRALLLENLPLSSSHRRTPTSATSPKRNSRTSATGSAGSC